MQAARIRRAVACICLALVVAVGGMSPGLARADDPFAPENERKDANTPAAQATTKSPLPVVENGPSSAKPAPAEKVPPATQLNATPVDDRIQFSVTVVPERARRGSLVRLTITGKPAVFYHTYPLTQRSSDPAQDEGGLSKLIYEDSPGIRPLWPITESKPEVEKIPEVGTFLEHANEFTWSQDLLILPDATPGIKDFRFRIKLQVCKENCVWGEPRFEAKIAVTDEPPLPLTPELEQRLQAKQPPITIVPVAGTASPTKAARAAESPAQAAPPPAAATSASSAPKPAEVSFFTFVFQGIVWGALSLLTPCVFPMIPITVSFFLKQAEKQHHRPLTMAMVYSSTIVIVLTIGGLLLIRLLQPLSQHWATNLALGCLFGFFALSLFGMYEIRLPTGLANYTSAHEGQGGLWGTMFMALTFTIISFTCVAPFYGGFIALAAAATTVGAWVKLFFGALAFSVTFASPFFLLAQFPSALRNLPRSGSWMNTIKVVMGFLELAAAFKFLRAGELILFGKAEVLSYDLVLGIYVAIALLCGLYLLNLYRLPHDDTPVEQLGVPRLLFSVFFLTLGFYLLPALFKLETGEKQRPNGRVFAWLDSFLLPDTTDEAAAAPGAAQSAGTKAGEIKRLSWFGNLDQGLSEAERDHRLVFIDFTGLT